MLLNITLSLLTQYVNRVYETIWHPSSVHHIIWLPHIAAAGLLLWAQLARDIQTFIHCSKTVAYKKRKTAHTYAI